MKNTGISRRGFLRILAAGGTAGVLAAAGLDKFTQPAKFSETRLLMGTLVNLTVMGDDPARARAAVRACLDRMSELEGLLSRFQPDSQVSQLNRSGRVEAASPALVDLITLSDQVSRWSEGAFDVTIKSLVDLYFQKQAASQAPAAEEVARARDLVNYRALSVSGGQVAFAQAGMGITLDGIAKGYIVDQGAAVLREHGFSSVLIEAGGDLLAAGEKTPGEGWRVGVQAPRGGTGLLAQFGIANRAAATSGDYLQAFTPDFRQHHIIDPRRGVSDAELASVTVLAGTTALADALATAVMVMGSQAGLRLVQRLPDVEALLVKKDGEQVKTAGFLV